MSSTNQDAADRLTRALGFVTRGWTRMYEAKMKDGWTCSPKSQHATCWCASGAMRAAGCTPRDFELVASCLGGKGEGAIVNYNDAPGRKRGDIFSLFRVAIRKVDQSRPVRA